MSTPPLKELLFNRYERAMPILREVTGVVELLVLWWRDKVNEAQIGFVVGSEMTGDQGRH